MHVRLHGSNWRDRIRYKFVIRITQGGFGHPGGRSLPGTFGCLPVLVDPNIFCTIERK